MRAFHNSQTALAVYARALPLHAALHYVLWQNVCSQPQAAQQSGDVAQWHVAVMRDKWLALGILAAFFAEEADEAEDTLALGSAIVGYMKIGRLQLSGSERS